MNFYKNTAIDIMFTANKWLQDKYSLFTSSMIMIWTNVSKMIFFETIQIKKKNKKIVEKLQGFVPN